MSALAELLACARAACHEASVEAFMIGRIELALEELFTNTVQHGYGKECESPVWLETSHTPAELRITYEDAAPPYNPLDHDADLDHSSRERPPGGLGLHLLRRLADEIAYRRMENRNVVTLVFQRQRSRPPT